MPEACIFHLPWTHLGIVWDRLTMHHLFILRYHSFIQPAWTFTEKAPKLPEHRYDFEQSHRFFSEVGGAGFQDCFNVNFNG